MDRFEQELRDAMRREPAPEWFADSVLARIRDEQQSRGKALSRFSLPAGWLRWAAGLAMLVVVLGGLRFEQVRQERIQGEAAKQQLILALKVTGSKLRIAQERVHAIQRFGAEE